MPNELQTFTWLGAVMLALCGVPQAWWAYKRPASTAGLSWPFLALWGAGELCLFAGLLNAASTQVLANYALNFLLVCYVMGVKWVNRTSL